MIDTERFRFAHVDKMCYVSLLDLPFPGDNGQFNNGKIM